MQLSKKTRLGNVIVCSYQTSALPPGRPRRMKKRLARKPNNVPGAGVAVSNPCCLPPHNTLPSPLPTLFSYSCARALSLSVASDQFLFSLFFLISISTLVCYPSPSHLPSHTRLVITPNFLSASIAISISLSHVISYKIILSLPISSLGLWNPEMKLPFVFSVCLRFALSSLYLHYLP